MEIRQTAVVTGASAGIGAATARHLRGAGFDVVIGARRLDRLHRLAEEIGARAFSLDVTDAMSVDAFCNRIESCAVLVNNAGGAFGLDPIASLGDDRMQDMYQLNVIGTVRMTRALLPKLIASGDGRIVNVGSVAGHFVYAGGGGYTAVKHALRAVTQTLRGELLGEPVRVIEIDPGMVETEFSLVRFEGDEARAAQVYADTHPLTADDVADCITWAVTRPPHVNIDQMSVMPRDQIAGFGQQVNRTTG